MQEGQIQKALSGFYYVEQNGEWIQCRGRGVFRKRGIHPLVGDQVYYEYDGENDAIITEVLPRKNELIRPPVANVDQGILVFSLVEPDFSSYLLDRFLVALHAHHIQPLICLTKKDKMETDEFTKLQPTLNYYESIGYTVLLKEESTAFKKEIGLQLKDKVTVLAGQSGVGKSTLLNSLVPTLELKTGIISEALGRGKHTTRHVELVQVADGLVADTPGFSTVDFDMIEKEQLATYFLELNEAASRCKFRGCLHVNEPKCEVKKRVEEGTILQSRYDHYTTFLQEIMERKPRYTK